MNDSHKITWTGHPLIDMGMAGLLSFAEKENPEELTTGDIDNYAEHAKKLYFTESIKKNTIVLFTTNFVNPSFKTLEKKTEHIENIIKSYQKSKLDCQCAFCQKPAVGMFHRDIVPMVTGRDQINFYTLGISGVPLCGYCITFLQLLAISAPLIEGKVVVVDTPDKELLIELVRQWQQLNIKYASLPDGGDLKVKAPLTRVLEAIEQSRLAENEHKNSYSDLTVYHLSNSGQGPDLTYYNLPTNIMSFLKRARTIRYSLAWDTLVKSGWQVIKDKKKETDLNNRKNYVYEDMFSLPDKAIIFVRKHFWGYYKKVVRQIWTGGEIKTTTSLQQLLELFLTEVVWMEKSRIEKIKALGDDLAQVIRDNGKKELIKILKANRQWIVRNLLVRYSLNSKKLLITLDDYLEVFEEGEEIARSDWAFAWDLVKIRVIEKLYDYGWLGEQAKTLTENDLEDLEQIEKA